MAAIAPRNWLIVEGQGKAACGRIISLPHPLSAALLPPTPGSRAAVAILGRKILICACETGGEGAGQSAGRTYGPSIAAQFTERALRRLCPPRRPINNVPFKFGCIARCGFGSRTRLTSDFFDPETGLQALRTLFFLLLSDFRSSKALSFFNRS